MPNHFHFNEQTTRAVYDFIAAYIGINEISPSVREIGEGTYMSHSNVFRYLERLEAKGLIQRKEGCARSIRILEPYPR
ncbi:hypothetical protein MASR2M15_27660 [Anaerolineales bacterium]